MSDKDRAGYLTWSNKSEFKQALAATSNKDYGASVSKTFGSIFGRTFVEHENNISVHAEYNRADYEYFRPGEAIPRNHKDMMHMAMLAYEKVSIVRSVIDMMSDFTVQGIRIVHPNKRIENFHRRWAKEINIEHVSERIANMLYRAGNCPVKIRTAKIKISTEKEFKQSYATEDIIIQKPKIDRRVIPFGYNILNPLTIEVIGGELAAFVGKPIYGLKLSHHFKMMMDKMERAAIQNESVNEMFKIIPDSLKVAVKAGKMIVPLDQDKIEMLHYKKDDWNVWATPMLAAIMDALIMLEKMHLADLSALDGAISQIRLWKLGSLEHNILPGRSMIARLRNILAKVGNGVLDLVWGPELDFKESNSQVHNYLKPDKYQQVMTEIYSGLGVPQSLTGSGGSSNTGFTNNFISMKTLVERLEYGRKILTRFWEQELKKIQKAMGWKYSANIIFDSKVLNDEIAERKLFLDMWDREIIPTETILEVAKRNPEIEIVRLKREKSQRERDNLPQKAGPYHNPQWELDLKKIVLQGGGVAPSEVGLELEERKEGEQSRHDQMMEMKKSDEASINKMPQKKGRPKNSKDKEQRKQRDVKVRTSASADSFISLFWWANETQEQISKIIAPAILAHYNKKNFRGLTKDQVETTEALKLKVLCNLYPYSDVNQETVYNLLSNDLKMDEDVLTGIAVLIKQFEGKHGKLPNLEEMRQIQSSAYAIKYEENNV